MNLCLNSRDAMPQGGKLLLETENVVVDEAMAARQPLARAGKFVRMRVRDNGQGIAPEVLPHIFEPFFTTKPPGQGTGLGLATVYGIIRQHNGWVECASRQGQGVCFDIYLPRANGGSGAGLRDRSAPPPFDRPAELVPEIGGEEFSGLSKSQAEEVLDWLDRRGYLFHEIAYREGAGFAVRWRRPPPPPGPTFSDPGPAEGEKGPPPASS